MSLSNNNGGGGGGYTPQFSDASAGSVPTTTVETPDFTSSMPEYFGGSGTGSDTGNGNGNGNGLNGAGSGELSPTAEADMNSAIQNDNIFANCFNCGDNGGTTPGTPTDGANPTGGTGDTTAPTAPVDQVVQTPRADVAPVTDQVAQTDVASARRDAPPPSLGRSGNG